MKRSRSFSHHSRAGTHHTHRHKPPTKDNALVLGVGNVGGKPVQTLVETLAGGGAGGLDEPVSLTDGVEAELVGDLGGGHGVGEILLVGENQQDGVAKLILLGSGEKMWCGGERGEKNIINRSV